MGEAGAYVGVGVCGKSLYLLLSFAVNLKLLQKNKVSLKKKRNNERWFAKEGK